MYKQIITIIISGAVLTACTDEMPATESQEPVTENQTSTAEYPKVTRENFATAETHRYMQEFMLRHMRAEEAAPRVELSPALEGRSDRRVARDWVRARLASDISGKTLKNLLSGPAQEESTG